MINEQVLKGMVGKRVSIAVKNIPHVSGGVLESIVDGCLVLNTGKTSDHEPQKVFIAISEVASVLVY